MFKSLSRTLILLGVVFVSVMGLTYGTFIYTSDSTKATQMIIGDLTYGIDITASNASVSGKTVNVSSNTTSIVNLKVTSLNEVETKYGIDYKITKGSGTVKYASNTGWLPTGKISKTNTGSYEKLVKIVINATTDMSVDFSITGGYEENDLNEVKSGYTRITEKSDNITSYDDTLTNVTEKEANNYIYGGESLNNYLQYPINDDNTKNIWRIIGYYNGIGTKIISNKTSDTTKTTLQDDLTSFYNTLENTDRFIIDTDKFNCTTSSCTSSSYSKIGLISVNEYNELGGVNSYLSSTDNFFALDNNTVKSITPTGIEESESSGLKPTIYLQDYVTVTGTGTVGDPFKLKLPEYTVTVNVVNGSTTLPSKMIIRGENVTYTLTPSTGYKNVIQSDTCNGSYSGNTYTISGVTENKNCTITFVPETYTLTFDVNGGNALSTNTKTITYNSTYGELPTPTRTGYTFKGWHNQLYTSSFSIAEDTGIINGRRFFTNIVPGETYNITINEAKVTQGSASSFTTLIYDYTLDQTLAYNDVNFGNNISYSLTAPSSTDQSHKLYFVIYSGLVGHTSGIGTSYTDLYIYSTNKLTKTTYTSSSRVESPYNHQLLADWEINKYNVTLSVSNGSGSTTKSVSHGSSVSFTVTPSSGYKAELETNSCGGTLSGSTYTVSNVTSAKTCNISFKKDGPKFYDKLLADKSTRPTGARGGSFDKQFTDTNTKTLYTSTENGTTVYYFAGNATDNWVEFGGFYWRIIRTNADGGIRLLYHGTSHDSTEAYIGTSAFNSTNNDSMYVGYMYGTSGTLESNRTNTNNSTIKEYIDSWYASNLTNYTKYLSTTAIYCNDREVGSGTYSATGSTFYFIDYTRLYTNKTPTYDCTNDSDAFSVSNSSAKLTYPIGLMTADEVSFAGDVRTSNSSNINVEAYYYRNSSITSTSSTNNKSWWTMSPSKWSGSYSLIFDACSSMIPLIMSGNRVSYVNGVRPVISLKSSVTWVSGDGSASSPYQVGLN